MTARTIPQPHTKLAAPPPDLRRLGTKAAPQRSRDAKIAALYPGVYTTHTNTVSHGASEPPNSVVLQPSAAIFDITMLVTGAMILTGAWFAYRALRRKSVLIPTALLGVGTVGFGTFPLTHPTPHTLFAFTAFLAGGIAVVLSSRLTAAPFRYLWMMLGTVALGATALAVDAFRTWWPDGRARRGWPRALDRVPDRPVAGGLWQLPDGGSGRSTVGGGRPPL